MNPVIVISERDNVATALEPLAPGRVIRLGDGSVTVLEPIPRGHKLALREIRAGQAILKYGSAIGTASTTIAPGAHVHTHNVASERGRGDLARQPDTINSPRIAEPPDDKADAAAQEAKPA